MTKITIASYIALALSLFITFLKFPNLFIWLVQEDKVIEWLTFWTYLSASFLFIWTFCIKHQKQNRVEWFFVILAIGCFFIAGEEISWGQRILGLETPEILAKRNFQKELTLHNLGDFGKSWPRRLYMIIVFLYLVVIPYFYKASHNIRKNLDKLRIIIPPSILILPFLCSLLLPFYVKFHVAFGLKLPVHHEYAGEVMELFSGFLFLHFSVLEAIRARSHDKFFKGSFLHFSH